MIKKSLLLFGAVAGAMMAIGTSSSNIAASISDANQKINVNCLNPAINNTAKISGFIKLTDDYGVIHNLQGIEVKLLVYLTASRTPTRARIAGTTYTDLSGTYSFTYSNDAFETIQELSEKTAFQIVISAKGEGFNIVDSNEETYSYTSEKFTIQRLGVAIFGHTFTTANDVGKGFCLTQPLAIVTKYARYIAQDREVPDVGVVYPDPRTTKTAFYGNNQLHIPEYNNSTLDISRYPRSYQDFDTVCHEYGHHLQVHFNLGSDPGGTHYIESNMQDVYLEGTTGTQYDESTSRDLGLRISYAEGWATGFSLLAQKYYESEINTWKFAADSSITSYTGLNTNFEKYGSKTGEACENVVVAFMWNLFDNKANISDPWDDVDLDDTLLIPISTDADTFYDFVSNIYEIGIESDAIETMLETLKVSTAHVKWDTLYTNIGPTFTWDTFNGSKNFGFTSYEVTLKSAERVCSHSVIDNENNETFSYKFSLHEWRFILGSCGDEVEFTVTGICDRGGIRTAYNSRTRHFKKPTIAMGTGSNILATPLSWGFATGYSNSPITKNIVKNGVTFETKRLRTSANTDNYLILSARKENCGKAYVEFVSDKAWAGIDYDVALWSDQEEITYLNSKMTVEVLNSDNQWVNDADLWRDISIQTGKSNMTRVTTFTTGPIYGIRITVVGPSVGTANLGRLAIGNINFKA